LLTSNQCRYCVKNHSPWTCLRILLLGHISRSHRLYILSSRRCIRAHRPTFSFVAYGRRRLRGARERKRNRRRKDERSSRDQDTVYTLEGNLPESFFIASRESARATRRYLVKLKNYPRIPFLLAATKRDEMRVLRMTGEVGG